MRHRLWMFVVMALGAGPAVAESGPLGPIVVPTGPGDEPDSGEIGDKPPNGPNDPGDIQPQRLPVTLTAAGGSAGFFGPILFPTGPGEDPDSTEIGDKPPPDPDDTGGICPRSSSVA